MKRLELLSHCCPTCKIVKILISELQWTYSALASVHCEVSSFSEFQNFSFPDFATFLVLAHAKIDNFIIRSISFHANATSRCE